MNKRVCKEDQIKLIMECRQSGLSDYQWCEQNGIHPGTFYNWVSKLKKSGYTLPDTQKNSEMKPEIQEVVKVGIKMGKWKRIYLNFLKKNKLPVLSR